MSDMFLPARHREAEGLVFYALFSFLLYSFFSMPNIWCHWTDLSQTWTHIHLRLLFKKFGQSSPGIYHPPLPTGWEAKNTCLRPTYELWPNISLQQNMISTIGEKLVIYRESPTCPQIWWTLVQKRLRTVK